MSGSETIVAIATAAGMGGIGIVRLSGPEARRIAQEQMLEPVELAAGRARFCRLAEREENSERVLDEAVLTFFEQGHSYTGEDVVEISAHGSPVVLRTILQACLRSGARIAEPGEFTRRAFLSGRLDLLQAEAVNDLIRSTTLHQARSAASQMGGTLSREVRPAKDLLVHLIAALEAGIDFAEDDIDVLSNAELQARIAGGLARLEKMDRSFAYGRLLREGLRIAIVGRPNAGKSSLFNSLLERERAIVTAAPGTTRDTVTETLALGGIPLVLTDTAGLRGGPDGTADLDEAETLGIRRSREALADADVILLVIDGTTEIGPEDRAILEGQVSGSGHLLVVLNKSDLPGFLGRTGRSADLQINGGPSARALDGVVDTSTRTGDGVEDLRSLILSVVHRDATDADGASLTNVRQHRALVEALEALRQAQANTAAALPHEIVLLDLHRALRALDELTGTTTSDDILGLIFSSFCIGK